jgi:hypothetical protein
MDVVNDSPGKSTQFTTAVTDKGSEEPGIPDCSERVQLRFRSTVAVALFAAGLIPLLTCTQ